ncbi:MAG: helix-turn-helix domain-containing protein [Planctomycetota bacterium]|nr:helix-turn-helix domain-containing protein [Planctomycetota bacterium]
MNTEARPPEFAPTSASGAMLVQRASKTLHIGILCLGIGTTSAVAPATDRVNDRFPQMIQTSAGSPAVAATRQTTAVSELRQLSGLSWDQLARILGVSRRSIHFWASGKTLTQANEEKLNRVLSVVRRLDRGSATANRAVLLGSLADGTIPFDLLINGDYSGALDAIGETRGARRRHQTSISATTDTIRTERSPADFMQTLHDPVHSEVGRGRIARSVRTRGSGQSE